MLIAASVTLLALFGFARSADARGGACDTTPTVMTVTQLNDAISCYNVQATPGPYLITLGGDIDLPVTENGFIEIAADAANTFSLTIDGDGHTSNVAVSNSTFAGNGVGISSSFQAAVASSIVDSCAGLVNDLGANFTTTATCLDFTQLSDDSLDTNLRNNGGHTKTIALLEGSNALAGGNCTSVPTTIAPDGSIAYGSVETDQRGAPRPTTGPCDAGAYEDAEVVCEPPNFTDVPGGAYYEAAVDWAACAGITNGTSPTTFGPKVTLTRAQMATFLWRFAGEPAPPATHPFTDVPAGAYYEDAVAWLAQTGVTTGTSPTTFSPKAPVTRAQMATFLWRFAGEPDPAAPHSFSDVPSGAYYDVAVAWLAETGVTTGTGPTTFGPKSRLTRAQTVTFLWRFNNLPSS
jgi:hypothetical protein